MSTRTAILIGALTIAVALAFLFRWQVEIRIDRGGEYIYRLDRWTGALVHCRELDFGRYDCERQRF
jgi:hypothetical protein